MDRYNRIKAKDPDKKTPFRDEQRAYYDSVRDILAARNGITLIRIKHRNYDWVSNSGKKIIGNLIDCSKPQTCSPDVDEIIEQISSYYVKLQENYREWATQFKSHEEVISWLRKNNIVKKEDIENGKYKQGSFNLLSSNWNSMTSPVLHEIASDCIAQMKIEFDKFSHNFSHDDCAWHLLYFIHPVLHELYYFDDHYPKGYYSRLERFIRIGKHGWGLAGVKKDDRRINGCSTFIFKPIHLHPTTSTWGKPLIQNIKEAIQRLEIGNDSLSSEEKNIAMALSAKATMTFNKWFDYAQCAINEGPIFSLKKGKCHSECFREIVKILQSDNPNQNIIRDQLKEYYKIYE